MDMYDTNLDDETLTKLRQEANKRETPKGFPIWLLTTYRLEDMEIIDQTVWFTRSGMEEYTNKVENLDDFIVDSKLLFVKDVKNVSYSVE